MDEIDKLNKLKKYIVLFVVLFILFFIFTISIFPHRWIKLAYTLSFQFFLLLVLPQILAYFFLKLKYRNSRNITNTLSNITREIIKKAPPAICSLIFNKKVEAYSDYTATILYLEQKGYIKIEGNDNNYSIIDLQKDITDLNNHEKYVYECICNNKDFDMNEFKNTVIKDAIDMDLIREGGVAITGAKAVIGTISFVIIMLALILLGMYVFVFYPQICMLIIVVLSIALKWMNIKNTEIESVYTLTKEGKSLQKHVIGLRNYIKEYTLLSEREIKEKEIFGSYIAYALSLGEGKTVEKFVSKNEQYRNLIYKK